MNLERLLKKHDGLVARVGDFKSKFLISDRKFEHDYGNCQDYAMQLLELPHYFWGVAGCISHILKKGFVSELSQTDRLEEGCLAAFHRRSRLNYYSHFGMVRERRKRNHSPFLFVVESKKGYGPVALDCFEDLAQVYGPYVDLYKKID